MRYKIGDKVKIKINIEVARDITEILKKTNRIVTIKKILGECYLMEEVRAHWKDYHIEELIPEPIIPELVTRFELMDIE